MEKVENKLHTQLVMRKPTKGAFDEEKSKINIMEYSTETRVTAESSNTGYNILCNSRAQSSLIIYQYILD